MLTAVAAPKPIRNRELAIHLMEDAAESVARVTGNARDDWMPNGIKAGQNLLVARDAFMTQLPKETQLAAALANDAIKVAAYSSWGLPHGFLAGFAEPDKFVREITDTARQNAARALELLRK